MSKCPKCRGYLYEGRNNTLWHTNVPGESIGREVDDLICLMTGFPRRERDTAWAESKRLRAIVVEVADSIPSTYDENDPTVKRHAKALRRCTREAAKAKESE